jgi:hypothetical protein
MLTLNQLLVSPRYHRGGKEASGVEGHGLPISKQIRKREKRLADGQPGNADRCLAQDNN